MPSDNSKTRGLTSDQNTIKLMKTTFFAIFALAIGQVAVAQGLPVAKYGQCPTGTSTQGGSCVPNGNNQAYWNNNQQCPLGFTKSQGYCVKSY
jgi:hypothetical protein